jgi:hypothetical protein
VKAALEGSGDKSKEANKKNLLQKASFRAQLVDKSVFDKT